MMTAKTQLRNHLKACLSAAEDMSAENRYSRTALFSVRAFIVNAIEALDMVDGQRDVDFDND